MTDTIDGLEDFFDNDVSLALLNVSITKGVNAKDVVAKSVYNFDLETPEGVLRLIGLLPIMDPQIINEVYQEVFPILRAGLLLVIIMEIQIIIQLVQLVGKKDIS